VSKILTTRQAQPPAVQQATHDVEMAKANAIAKAGDLLPRNYRSNPGAVLLAMDWADRVGLSVMDAIHGVAWVQGKPVIDATLLRALATRAGYRVLVTDASRESATAKVVLTGTGETLGTVTYTIEDARTAGLAGKDNWKKNPEDMLVARATSRAVRRYCSDALVGGALTEDEAEVLEVDVPTVTLTEPVVEAEVSDAEIVEEPAPAPKRVPAPPVAVQAEPDDKPSPELLGGTKAAVDLAKGRGVYSTLAEAMKAEDIPLSSQKWTAGHCERINAMIASLPDTITEED
jgi:hypothetical protein